MFDQRKLEAFLDTLEVEQKIIAPPRSALDVKMDKYDLFKQDDYENVGMPEMPLYALRQPFSIQNIWTAVYPTYGGIYPSGAMMKSLAFHRIWDDTELPAPVKDPHEILKDKIGQLHGVVPAKVANPNPAPPAPEKSPDYVHTLTAWRGWNVTYGMLTALGSPHTWKPKGVDKARCLINYHPAPEKNCSCGFWSFRNFKDLIEAMKPYADKVQVIGTVEIWGRVIECMNGFRSEYSYPKELWLLNEGLESLSWTYGVPVRKL
jgi:hypothetical protein